ncbi:hypothetical protein MFIFM68171_03060 [Madurella fahalii]|uniref:Uncharacterized protein n=1 Tax=Madurella fahalii TaxID=1157608 RepID=A0ABQ0G533_9PEZI
MARVVHVSVRSRYRFLFLLGVALFICSLSPQTREWSSAASSAVPWPHSRISASFRGSSGFWRPRLHTKTTPGNGFTQSQIPLEILETNFFNWADPSHPARPKPPYKPPREPSPPITDPFPLLSQNPPPKRSQLQAPIPYRPPKRHVPEQTPLFVGFTRNWPQLLQCVVSYIAAGWPAEDIYVFENTGVMFANRDGKLTLQNPFYLNHTQLQMLGVNVIITPTLLTFSQLQNFYLWTALSRSLQHYFWTHQDLLVLSHPPPSPTIYQHAVSVLRHYVASEPPATAPATTAAPRRGWAHHFFAYDHLALVHRDAVLAAGGWDTHIPFYASDCDMYVRLMWAGYWQGQSGSGVILDVASVLEDVGALLGIKGVKARLRGVAATTTDTNGMDDDDDDDDDGDDAYVETRERLLELGLQMEKEKYAEGTALRNTWQMRQAGGQGEPFYRDPEGFEVGVRMMIDTGRAVFAEKWGHRGCDIARTGVKAEDAWRLERDWDEETEGTGAEGGSW